MPCSLATRVCAYFRWAPVIYREMGLLVAMESVRQLTRQHERCGTFPKVWIGAFESAGRGLSIATLISAQFTGPLQKLIQRGSKSAFCSRPLILLLVVPYIYHFFVFCFLYSLVVVSNPPLILSNFLRQSRNNCRKRAVFALLWQSERRVLLLLLSLTSVWVCSFALYPSWQSHRVRHPSLNEPVMFSGYVINIWMIGIDSLAGCLGQSLARQRV